MPENRRVVLCPHDPGWANIAAAERTRWRAAIGDALVTIDHIGSTAIGGIAAKPIIDLLATVASLDAFDACAPQVVALGYQWRGEFGIAGRRYCTDDDLVTGARRFQVHAFARGDAQIERHLAFRDYLRAHPREASDYEAEKRRVAALHSEDWGEYAEAKSPWIRACDDRARAWRLRSDFAS
ncbi:MAG: GrpB family protein [Pirellulales bacterium]|nr:GrpB family protein [Pirellulales bacterium]